jgi:high-affinity iron transporter
MIAHGMFVLRCAIRCAIGIILTFSALTTAQAQQATPETTWRLLDYIAVDYSGAVSNGRVIDQAEYAEMVEFSGTVESSLRTLRPTEAQPALVAQAGELREAIVRKASPDAVSALARALAARLLQAYPVPLGPTAVPDLKRGAALYASQCAACHGAAGDGRGPMAAKLDPPPIDFTDRNRADQRSLFALEQVISQGLEGTGMQSFAHLPPQDRWALAFHVGSFAYPSSLVREGERIWTGDRQLRRMVPDLKALAGVAPQHLAAQIGEAKAAAVTAYLRSNPQAVDQGDDGSLALTRSRLAESIAAYRSGDAAAAKRLALSAYLDGFEPLEPQLAARSPGLLRQIEAAMAELRARIGRGDPVGRVEQQANALDGLLTEAERVLAQRPEGAAFSTLLSAFTILLREGVEAILIVIAMIAFLRKSDRSDALGYVHAGWLAALVAGALTWLAATTFLSISGATRELTEGFGGLFAAVVLVSVGIWMHGKSQADAWQKYIRERMDRALTRGSAWFLFGLAFLVVYREVFETILFFAAMWTEGSKGAVVGGAALGVVALAVLAWTMMRYSLRLPIAEFFRYSSILIAILAVVLAGKGIAAIQEAGLIGMTPVSGVPTIEVVGLHPTLQVILAQLLFAAALAGGFWFNARKMARARR